MSNFSKNLKVINSLQIFFTYINHKLAMAFSGFVIVMDEKKQQDT